MNKEQLLYEILAVLKTVKDDKDKLEEIHTFFIEEINEEEICEEEIIIPKKYKKIITDIASEIETGLIYYINTKTNETTTIIPEIDDYDCWQEVADTIESWNEKIKIEPINSNQGYQIMEDFTDKLNDKKLQNKLYNALDKRNPFANFRDIIDNSDYNESWFAFKQNWLEKFVYTELKNHDYIIEN